jgi:hypothetical protein
MKTNFLILFLVFGGMNCLAQPAISVINPVYGKIGDTIGISGANFDPVPANNIVYFGATRAVVAQSAADSLVVMVPVGATFMPVSVGNASTGLCGYSAQAFMPSFNNVPASYGGGFWPQCKYLATRKTPLSLTIEDFDGDGKPDLAVVNANDGTVSVFRNISSTGSTSPGSFATKVDFATGMTPCGIRSADIDGDGMPDLIIVNAESNTLSVLRNTTTCGTIDSSSFAAKVDFPTGSYPTCVAVGDLDGDGKIDLAITNYSDNTLTLLRNTSNAGNITTGSFAPAVVLPTESNPESIAIGNLDSDSKPELIVANNGANTVSVFGNTCTVGNLTISGFATKVDFATGLGPIDVAIADVDGDGRPDIAVVNNVSNTISLLRNTGSGSINPGSLCAKVDFETGMAPRSIAIGDINGDNKPDLAVTNSSSGTVSIYCGTGTAGGISSFSLAAKTDWTTGTNPFGAAVGDLDGDGRPDLAVANNGSDSVSVFLSSTQGKPLHLLTGKDEGQVTISVIPNPNSGTFMLLGEAGTAPKSDISIRITDAAGAVIYDKKSIAYGGKVIEDISTGKKLADGIYFVSMDTQIGSTEIAMLIQN